MEDYSQIPFYRMYPVQEHAFYNMDSSTGMRTGNNPYAARGQYLLEQEYERDFDRMRRMYPEKVRLLSDYVEEACEKLEYEGSLMYDECPDQLMVRNTARRICRRVAQTEEPKDLGAQNRQNDRGMEDLVLILLYNEMYKRRCRRRRCCPRVLY